MSDQVALNGDKEALKGDEEASKAREMCSMAMGKFLKIGLWNQLLPFSSHYKIKTRY